MRRTILVVLAALVAVIALGSAVVATSGDSSTVTRPRLERSLTTTFANLYVDQARIEGRDITASSLHATSMCDKAGAENKDVGPGGDWVCLVSWTDPEVPMPPEGYGKFELNVHSNDCYTAGGPSKLTGFLTMTDAHGREVTNPVFEFDGCFDPNGDDTPTGIVFPSLLSVASTTVTPDADGKAGLQVTCGTGEKGCAGTVVAVAGGQELGSMPIDLAEEATATLPLPTAVPPGATEVTFTVHLTTGAGPTSPVTLPVQAP
ncbi:MULTISPECIES: hypothetical protein [unclassified Nocardioides]|uniref:hypothetical protein n=1 Tax=unclassified Nocardioides TaxID=2615069 RepID=UPI0009F00573|nr:MULTISPECIES: hypothetical protein [unclassified Nocardioides]GAW51876.1 uncharacterized protein PD653B2_4225 [Nocardioides sp. PD653-B2]GAW53470.1 uncharacterized protein PD653_0869 [Nocardioides sp. PD653]